MARTHAQTRKPASRLQRATLPPMAAKSHPAAAAQVREALHSPRLQPKLTVGPPDDAFEHEADQVAEQVMRMPEPAAGGSFAGPPAIQRLCTECDEEMRRQPLEEPEEEPEQALQSKAMPGCIPQVTPDLEPRLGALRGSGSPLPASERAFFEPRFGSDFGDVRVHTGSEAADLARRVEARAFTLGRSVVFGAGQYAPGTTAGRALLAHELTHVVQQGGAVPGKEPRAQVRATPESSQEQRLQRKIVVAGKDYAPTAKYLRWLQKHYGRAMVELIERMHDSGKEPSYKFASFEQLGDEVRLRHHAIQGMEKIHKGCCSYPIGTGELDPDYWLKVGHYQFKVKSPLPAGKKASDAIEAIFNARPHPQICEPLAGKDICEPDPDTTFCYPNVETDLRSPSMQICTPTGSTESCEQRAGTELECNTAMVAIQYRAMLRTLGKEAFNKKFPEGLGIFISMYFTPPDEGARLQHPLWSMQLFQNVIIRSAADLLPGDWVYFKNIADYSSRHNGPWSGENCLYLGGGKFRGFGMSGAEGGLESVTEKEMKQILLDKYNEGLPENEQKKSVNEVPGLLTDAVYRPVVGQIAR